MRLDEPYPPCSPLRTRPQQQRRLPPRVLSPGSPSPTGANADQLSAAPSPVGSQRRVMISALLGLWVGVHQRSGQARQRVQQVVLSADRDLVGLDRAGTGIDDHLTFGAQMVP